MILIYYHGFFSAAVASRRGGGGVYDRGLGFNLVNVGVGGCLVAGHCDSQPRAIWELENWLDLPADGEKVALWDDGRCNLQTLQKMNVSPGSFTPFQMWAPQISSPSCCLWELLPGSHLHSQFLYLPETQREARIRLLRYSSIFLEYKTGMIDD